MRIEWVDGFEIRVSIEKGEAVISANKEGLLSLAKQLTALAEEVPGTHIHYDQYNSLDDGSTELIIVRTGDRKDDTDVHITSKCTICGKEETSYLLI